MAGIPRHKVFISFHHEDQEYKDRFVRMMNDFMVDKSVDTGDIIDSGLRVDEVRRQIRDDYIADATVSVVLIGPCTWQRKHVDWEIAASLTDTDHNDRCGLLGIRLPIHTDSHEAECNPRLLPPEACRQLRGERPFRGRSSLVGKRQRGEPGPQVDRRCVLTTETTARPVQQPPAVRGQSTHGLFSRLAELD